MCLHIRQAENPVAPPERNKDQLKKTALGHVRMLQKKPVRVEWVI